MRIFNLFHLGAFVGLAGCASMQKPDPEPAARLPPMTAARAQDSAIKPVAYQEPAKLPSGVGTASEPGRPAAAASTPTPATPAPIPLDELVQYAVGQNPRLARATFAIDAAQGEYVQAGLYPNPMFTANWDEIGDRTGAGGILNVPRFTQEFVTAHKLSLSQAVAARVVDQAALGLMRERYLLIAGVRSAYYDLYALERRIAVLDQLVKLSGDAVNNGKILYDREAIARLDLVQLEVEYSRFHSQAESARQELPGARKRLAAVVGNPNLPLSDAIGPYEQLPDYDLESTVETVLTAHPEVQSAKVGVDRATAAVRRAEVEPIPNVTFTTGYVRQYENKSHDFSMGLSAPIPVFNRNQGNIRAAKAQLSMAIQEVNRVKNDLADRVSTAARNYSAAKKLAEKYRTDILPKSEETYKLSLIAFKGGQFEYLRVIQAQRAVAEARLIYNGALGDAWKAAADLSGLLLQEMWPGTVVAPASNPNPAPMPNPNPAPKPN